MIGLPQLYEQFKRLAPIPESEWEKATKTFSPRTLKKSEFFCRAGEMPDSVGIIQKGYVRHFYLDRDGA